MSTPSDTTRRWVATLIVLLLVLQAGNWLWRKYNKAKVTLRQQAEIAVQRKIAASRAYDDALLRANTLLNHQDTVAAGQLLDSLRQKPTDSLFQIERQKLLATLQRLDSVRAGKAKPL